MKRLIGLLVLCLFTLILNPSLSIGQPQERPNIQTWYKWVKFCCSEADVDPYFALAVAHIESRKGNQDFRFGKCGKFYLPFGIHKDFKKKWPEVEDPFINTCIGVRALRGSGECDATKRKVLRRYNTTFDESYWFAVKRAEKEFRQERIFE